MYRIGIIGTENSHAITFAKLLNLPDEQGRYRHEDARIVGVYGPDMESAQEIVEKTGVSFIADKPEDSHREGRRNDDHIPAGVRPRTVRHAVYGSGNPTFSG